MSDTQDTPTPAETAAAEAQNGAQANAQPGNAQHGTQHGSETATPPTDAERIATLEAELGQMREKWLRAEAEMQNLRTRTKREIEDSRLYAVQKFARDVVETAENLRRGLDSLPAAAEDEPEILGKLRGGFEGVERAFVTMLERHGIARLDAQGQPFDPELHQAMAEQPAPEGTEPGTVIQAWTPAWTLHGRLLKPAMVVVAGK
ncbi:nucleotide exchange factor GrpE [Falsiroseomonas sp.]|uniref:nucleotide exchange factor GrpE n=1 Tax=Falsiroseomonas sp. TaxID=2870721 RepID=UPI002715933F|nr:nucleotide exchange factor GrpE [Falsiroseomonas sp.]MDO9503591.1 nucleotide exchange factor GrpE [Falsiroseomonas sp.]